MLKLKSSTIFIYKSPHSDAPSFIHLLPVDKKAIDLYVWRLYNVLIAMQAGMNSKLNIPRKPNDVARE